MSYRKPPGITTSELWWHEKKIIVCGCDLIFHRSVKSIDKSNVCHHGKKYVKIYIIQYKCQLINRLLPIARHICDRVPKF